MHIKEHNVTDQTVIKHRMRLMSLKWCSQTPSTGKCLSKISHITDKVFEYNYYKVALSEQTPNKWVFASILILEMCRNTLIHLNYSLSLGEGPSV